MTVPTMVAGYTLLMTTDPETLYRQLGRLIETMPDLAQAGPLPSETYLWLARAFTLVSEVANFGDAPMFKLSENRLGTVSGHQVPYEDRHRAAHEIRSIVYRALAVAESKAPAGVGGAFIPVGNSFDAFTALSKVLATATRDVLIVDPYLDETALTDFACAVPENVCLRLMADRADCKPTLHPAALKWVQQYGTTRPLLARLAPPKALHDRVVFIDQTIAWTLTQSLKDFAKRSPAEIVRADDTAALKIAAYEDIWSSAMVIV